MRPARSRKTCRSTPISCSSSSSVGFHSNSRHLFVESVESTQKALIDCSLFDRLRRIPRHRSRFRHQTLRPLPPQLVAALARRLHIIHLLLVSRSHRRLPAAQVPPRRLSPDTPAGPYGQSSGRLRLAEEDDLGAARFCDDGATRPRVLCQTSRGSTKQLPERPDSGAENVRLLGADRASPVPELTSLSHRFLERQLTQRMPRSYRRFLWFMGVIGLTLLALIIGQAFATVYLSTLPHSSFDGLVYVWTWIATVNVGFLVVLFRREWRALTIAHHRSCGRSAAGFSCAKCAARPSSASFASTTSFSTTSSTGLSSLDSAPPIKLSTSRSSRPSSSSLGTRSR